jgi:hypothetical protein
MIEYKNDVDLSKKIQHGEYFYHYLRPHGGFNGKTPYEVLRQKMIK